MTQTGEIALVGRVVRTIRWAVGVFRGQSQRTPPTAELAGAADELTVAANALEHLTRNDAELRYRNYLLRQAFDVGPRVELVQVANTYGAPLACPRCGSLDFSADAVTWSCESCGHTVAWTEACHG